MELSEQSHASGGVRGVRLEERWHGLLKKEISAGSTLVAFSYEVLKYVSGAVCKITADHGKRGTAFLAKLSMADGGGSGGVLTNNHVLSKKELADGKTFIIQFDAVLVSDSTNPSGLSPLVLTVSATGKFRFTCQVLDVTFVRLNDNDIQHLLSSGCQFLDVSEREGASDEQIFVFQYPQGNQGLRLAYGFCLRYYGTDLFHSADTLRGSSGSPVALSSGEVIGIHRSAGLANNYNIAVAIKPVVKAINELKHSFCRKLFYNPALKQHYVDFLCSRGLKPCNSHSKYGHLYFSPATYRLYIIPKKPPVWFVPTIHGWYWTLTDPSDKKKDTKWMPVSQLQVNGCYLDGEFLSEDDVHIINWLCHHNIHNISSKRKKCTI